MIKKFAFASAGFVVMAVLASTLPAQFTVDGTQARVGQTFSVTVSGGFPNSVWMLGIDTDPGPTSFPSQGLSVDLGFSPAFVAINDQLCDGNGDGQIAFQPILDNTLAGVAFYIQALNTDPTNVLNIAKSNLREAVIHPSDPGVGTVTPLTVNDDGSVLVSFGFNFPFYGQTYSDVYVNANGNMTFGQANSSFLVDESFFLGGPPCVAPFFTDLNPELGGTIDVDTTAIPGQALAVRFNGVADNSGSGPTTFTVTFYVGGHIAFDFGSVGPTNSVITGISSGGQTTTNGQDLSTPGFEAYGAPLGIYQVFSSANPFDLQNSYLLFGRVGNAGYLTFF